MLNTIKTWLYTGPDLGLDFDDINVPVDTSIPDSLKPSEAEQNRFRAECVKLGYMKQI